MELRISTAKEDSKRTIRRFKKWILLTGILFMIIPMAINFAMAFSPIDYKKPLENNLSTRFHYDLSKNLSLPSRRNSSLPELPVLEPQRVADCSQIIKGSRPNTSSYNGVTIHMKLIYIHFVNSIFFNWHFGDFQSV